MRALLAIGLAACGRIGFDAAPDGSTVLDPSLVAWYPMDDMMIAGAVDVAGHHSAVCAATATCPSNAVGVHGSAALFDGTAAYSIADDGTFALMQGTIALWLRLDTDPATTAGQFEEVFEKEVDLANGNFSSYESFLYPDVATLVDVGGDAVADTDYAETSWPGLGSWHHLAMTWNPTSTQLYLDGVAANTHAFGVMFDSHSIVLGANFDGAVLGGFLHGALDDVRIYDRELAGTEIAGLATP